MRRYELMLLLRPDLEDDKLQSAVERVTRAIVNAGGSLSKVSPWGKRRLAYEIGHHREASYFLIHFDIEPSAVRGIERSLLITEEILRHMVTLLEERAPDRRELDEAVAAAEPDAGREPVAPAADEGESPAAGDASAAAEEPVADEEASESEAADEPSEEPATSGAVEGAER
jgi:small subunit ribosomal protein S6